jgi:hypothetical protein
MQSVGTYVYGIVPSDVELVPDIRGVGDPPGEVDMVRHGEVAALVSKIDLGQPLGRPDDLKVHAQLLDATAAADIPVLPIRFGAVLSDPDAVANDLLDEHHDLFAAALRELEGRAEYIVHGRYVEEAVLREVLAENSAARSLRDQLRELPDEAAQDVRIQLGEVVNQAVGAKREVDTARVIEALTPHTVASALREPSHEEDAVQVAFLAELSKEQDVEDALEEVASDWEGRVDLTLRGPMAPYDFVVTLDPGA